MSDALKRLAELRGSLILAAKELFKVRNKRGQLVPLELNAAQLYVHQKLEEQRRKHGFVRALILKGRQQGISTYVAARYYHRTSMHRGVNTYILAHEQTASETLFGIVDRYHVNNPFGPHVGASNAKELEFDKLDSSYTVATAGQKAGGRSKALTLFHGSEVAFWPNAGEHFAASVQGVPLEPGTEIILESTSAGAGGEFYERCQDAVAGIGDYIMIFLPWWLSPEYSREPEYGFHLSEEEVDGRMSEREYAETYGLSLPQMAWRRAKIAELRDPLLFQREYPATVAEAWTAPPGHEPYISSLQVLRARKRKGVEGYGPLIIGIDPASGGGDRFAICWRRGLLVEKIEYRNKIDILEAFEWVRSIIEEDKPARVNIDAGNIGANLVTMLKAHKPQFAEIVRGVNFGGTSQAKLAKPKVPGPHNRRAEMYQRGKEWLDMPEGVALPDREDLQADLTAPKMVPRLDNDFLLESKVDMRKRGVRSPDLGDAWALTFASNEFIREYHDKTRPVGYGDLTTNVTTTENYTTYGGSDTGWMGI